MTAEMLHECYRKAKDPVERTYWHMLWQIKEGKSPLFLPPYSPELQPAERLWPLNNELLANRAFASLDKLQQVQVVASPSCTYSRLHPFPLVANLFGYSLRGVHISNERPLGED